MEKIFVVTRVVELADSVLLGLAAFTNIESAEKRVGELFDFDKASYGIESWYGFTEKNRGSYKDDSGYAIDFSSDFRRVTVQTKQITVEN